MKVVRTVQELRRTVANMRQAGERIGCVPTMGALHKGHESLITLAKQRVDQVVVSVFVNPTQFGPNEDFAAYPRQEKEDLQKLEEAGVAVAYLPTIEEMYAKGFATSVSVKGLTEGLCGAFRPGHFDGVALVVTKLLLQVQPDVAVFGEKDYQQLAVIRRLVLDLDIPVEIVGAPILREADGLAMSSRNAYLSQDERQSAPKLYAMLQTTATQIKAAPNRVAEVLTLAKEGVKQAGFTAVEYVSLCDSETLQPLEIADRPARLLVAAKLGKCRLIDNIPVDL